MSGTKYSKAPIAEAVIDIQALYAEQLSSLSLSQLSESVSSTLPISNKIRALELGLSNAGEDSLTSHVDQRNIGLRLTDNGNSRVLQIRDVGFTYSHLPPYTAWENFRGEAEPLWHNFVKFCKPVKVHRCAVRYINKIVMPIPRFDAEDYFNIYPTIPKQISQDISGLFMQLVMPQTDLDETSTAVINVTFDTSSGPSTPAIVLDFDIYKSVELDPNSPEIWEVLEIFRARKNELFEACITDKTREIIR